MKTDNIGDYPKVPTAYTKAVQNVNLPSEEWRSKLGVKTTHKGRGVIYVGHLPHGFYEEALHNYFKQFGEITRLSVGRSIKTGKPRGFAFIEFFYKEVAQVAASTMNNYLMFDKLLKCEFVPHNKVKPNMFINSEATRLNWPKKMKRERAMLQHNRDRSDAELEKSSQRRQRKLFGIKRKLQSLGVDYDVEDVLDSAEEEGKEKTTKNETKEKQEKVAVCGSKEEVSMCSTDNSHKMHVLEIHDSEEEVDFRTPPGTVKRRLLSTSKIDNINESFLETKKKNQPGSNKKVSIETGMEKKKVQKKTKKLSKMKSSCPEITEEKVTKVKAGKLNATVKGKISKGLVSKKPKEARGKDTRIGLQYREGNLEKKKKMLVGTMMKKSLPKKMKTVVKKNVL